MITTVDRRIFQTLVIQQDPQPQLQSFLFEVGSLLRMDGMNRAPRAGSKIWKHNVEIWGDRGLPTTHDAGFEYFVHLL